MDKKPKKRTPAKNKKPSTTRTSKKSNVATKKKVTPEKIKQKNEEFKNNPPQGLGDVVEKVTTKTGIKNLVEKWLPEDCGCNDRRTAWNRIRLSTKFSPVRGFTLEQLEWWGKHKEKEINKKIVTEEVKQKYIEIALQLFAFDYTKSFKKNCSTCVKEIRYNVNQVYDSYFD